MKATDPYTRERERGGHINRDRETETEPEADRHVETDPKRETERDRNIEMLKERDVYRQRQRQRERERERDREKSWTPVNVCAVATGNNINIPSDASCPPGCPDHPEVRGSLTENHRSVTPPPTGPAGHCHYAAIITHSELIHPSSRPC